MMKTPAERLHEELSKIVQESDDLFMTPEVRDTIMNGQFVEISLMDEGQESGFLMLNQDEMCVYFAISAQVKQTDRLSGFVADGVSYDTLLGCRNSSVSRAMYQTEFVAVPGYLVVTSQRLIFLPQSERTQNNRPVVMNARKYDRIEKADDMWELHIS